VIPVSVSIRSGGASRAATTSFLLSTPQTGVDSILVTHAVLGPLFAVYRAVAALLTGVIGGVLVQLFAEPNHAGAAGSQAVAATQECGDGCCSSSPQQSSRWARLFRYGFLTLPKDIAGPLIVGILIAGVMAAVVPPNRLEAYIGGGIVSILLLMAAGIPVYVCATASVPIAAGLMHMGASAGAALAFLIAGPATNAATFTTLWKILGRRTAALYLITVAVSALGCGLLLDWLMPRAAAALPQLVGHIEGHEGLAWWSHALAILLLAVLAFAVFWKPAAKLPAPTASEDLTAVTSPMQVELEVRGMTCGHCAESVQKALAGCAGVQGATVDRDRGFVTVRGESLNPGLLVAKISDLGFAAKVHK
jgi:uncharacterized membrane protein YraQ (UPF0718 family)/copper chaperone CopZ